MKQKKIFYGLSLVLLFFITAFRNPDLGGRDAAVYQKCFEAVPSIIDFSDFSGTFGFAYGYLCLNAVVKAFSNNYLVFQAVYAALTIFLLHLVIHELEFKYKERCIFLFSYFCFHFIWNEWIVYRQNIANLFFWLFVILFFKNRNKRGWKPKMWFFAALIVPALFHSSAWANIALLPIVLLFEKINWKKKMIWVPIASAVLYIFGSRIYMGLIYIMATFVNRSYENYGAVESNIINYILRLFFFILFARRFVNEDFEQKEVIFDTFAMMVLIGSFNAEATTRMYEYFAIGLYGCMAQFLHNFTRSSQALAAGLYYIGMVSILCRYVVLFDSGFFMNFRFCF